MIWRQDGDPPRSEWEYWHIRRSRLGRLPLMCPALTASQIREVSAHELADTVTMILSGNASSSGLGEYRSLWHQEPEAMEPVRLLSPKELKRINDASAIMHEHSRIVRSLMLVNEKIARARFTTFYAPKASQHLLRRLLPRKRKLLARLRVVRTRRKAFNARHR